MSEIDTPITCGLTGREARPNRLRVCMYSFRILIELHRSVTSGYKLYSGEDFFRALMIALVTKRGLEFSRFRSKNIRISGTGGL